MKFTLATCWLSWTGTGHKYYIDILLWYYLEPFKSSLVSFVEKNPTGVWLFVPGLEKKKRPLSVIYLGHALIKYSLGPKHILAITAITEYVVKFA